METTSRNMTSSINSCKMKKLFAAIIAAAGLVSCVNVDERLGGDLIASNQQYDLYTADLDLKEVLMQQVDSLTAYSDNRITFGSIREDTYGLTKRGCVINLVPVLNKTVSFGKDPKFQKFKFKCAIDSTSVYDLSQSNILQNVNVYPLTEPVGDKDYFSQAKVNYSDKKITRGTPVVNGKDSLVFELNEEYARTFFDMTTEDTKDMATYKKKYPGIYITTEDPSGNGGRINMFKMDFMERNNGNVIRTDNYAVLYFNSEFNGERKDTMVMFYFSPADFQDLDSLINIVETPKQYVFNVDYHENSASLAGPAKDKIYVEGGSGIKPVVTSRQIRDLICDEIRKKGGDPMTTVISKATIEFPFEYTGDYTTMFRFPDNLSPAIKISRDSTVTYAGLTDASVKTENQGDINRSQCVYSPDMTHHVQQIIRLKDDADFTRYDIWFLIMWYKTTTSTNLEAEELAEYYQQLAYYSYYNQIYGGGYGGYGGYSSYGSSAYSSYYSYMMMAQYAASAASQSNTTEELDKDHFYSCVLNGPEAEGRKPKLKVTFAIPKK